MMHGARDPAFLRMAIIAGTGGVLAIVFSIGFPIWMFLHGRPYTPAFSLFAAWGLAALGGAYACTKTYMISGIDPDRPPRGGIALKIVSNATVRPASRSDDAATTKRAA